MSNKSLLAVKITAISAAVIIMFSLSLIFGYNIGLKHKTIIVHLDLDEVSLSENNENCRYKFLDENLSNYICTLSSELKIDPDLVVSILMRENPKFDPAAEHRNSNGTNDCGLFQLNDRSTYSSFLPSYWDINVEFNIYNWKHNTFIACHYIQDLTNFLKTQDEIIMAYNCGLSRTMQGTNIPASTYEYLAAVKNNYKLLTQSRDACNE